MTNEDVSPDAPATEAAPAAEAPPESVRLAPRLVPADPADNETLKHVLTLYEVDPKSEHFRPLRVIDQVENLSGKKTEAIDLKDRVDGLLALQDSHIGAQISEGKISAGDVIYARVILQRLQLDPDPSWTPIGNVGPVVRITRDGAVTIWQRLTEAAALSGMLVV